MYIALDKEHKRISMEQAVQGDVFFCPFCMERMFLKVCKERTSHFSHYPHSECNDSWNGQYDMSDWHYEWQHQFPAENQEVILRWEDIRHRADVLTGRTVIEFQHSPLSAGKFNDRNVFYHSNIGFKVIWLYDMRTEFDGDNIFEVRKNIYSWRKPFQTFNNYSLKAGQIELFFQTEDEGKCIAYISDLNSGGFSVKKWYTKEEFLAYAGLVNGECAPPAHDDLQIDEQYREFAEKYNIKLNMQQQRAVQAVDGANLMIAVPGSGKTTVLVARIGYMVFCRGIDPRNILAITYTKSAVQDIRSRIAEKFGSSLADCLDIRTINSLCDQIISIYSRGRQRFELLSEKEQKDIIRSIYTELTEDKFPHDADIIAAQTDISYVKNMMLETPEQRSEYYSEDSDQEEFYIKYRDTLRELRKMDYDDQMVFARSILSKRPDILKWFQGKYRYICVDEAQDTSKIQHYIIHQLAEGHNNIFMVGDEDQSIYGFRAAYPQALMNFSDIYINPYIMFLETNYRSTKQIVYAAQNFISRNKERHSEKHMIPSRGAEKGIERINVSEKHEQYSKITEICNGEHGQIAVLYRNNNSSIPIMDLFMRNNIPYKRLQEKGENFFTSRVVNDITAFLRFSLEQRDADAFMQIYYKCGYGFNKQTAEWSCRKSRSKGITITEELLNQLDQWKKLQLKAFDFKDKIRAISAAPPQKAIQMIRNYWYQKYAADNGLDIGKVDILEALALNEATIKGFLVRLSALPSLIENNRCNTDDAVILTTVHSSKGLEFDTVYMIDVYDGCFPHAEKDDDNPVDSYEEERRLFYVGITRAKNELKLFSVSKYRCPFVEEIVPTPKQQTTHNSNKPQVYLQENINSRRAAAQLSSALKSPVNVILKAEPAANGADLDEITVGNRVVRAGDKIVHVNRGEGTIKRMYYSGKCLIISVQHGKDPNDITNYDFKTSLSMKFISFP